jgi:multidrug resistance protein
MKEKSSQSNGSAQAETANGKSSKMPLLLIFLTVFIDLVGFGVIIPLLPTYAEKFGANALEIGFLLMSYSLAQFFFTPFWGRLSDNVGRKPILLTSLAASTIGYVMWGFSGSLLMLFASRIVAGLGNANIAVAQAYISDITTEQNRAKGMGLVGAAFGLGFVLGPAIGGALSSFGLQFAGFIAAFFSLLDLVLTFFFLPEPKERSRAGHERFKLDLGFYTRNLTAKNLRVALAIFLISTFAFANMEATLVLLTEKRFGYSAQQNGWMFAFIGLVMVIMQGGLIGRLSQKFGEKKLVIAGSFIAGCGLLATAYASNQALLYFACALLAIGSGMYTPSNQSVISKLSNKEEVGGVLGIGQSLSTLGRILGPVAGGAAFEYIGMESPYFIGAGVMAFAVGLALLLPTIPETASQAKLNSDAKAADPKTVEIC